METVTFTLQPAAWRDVGSLRKLEQECFGQDAWPLLDLIGVLTIPNIVRIKAVDGDANMIGFIAGDPDRDKNIGWVTTVGVLPVYRRKGVATALLAECEQQMGMQKVRLCVRRSNHGAIELYEKLGYHLMDIWEKYYAGGEDALVLEKKR